MSVCERNNAVEPVIAAAVQPDDTLSLGTNLPATVEATGNSSDNAVPLCTDVQESLETAAVPSNDDTYLQTNMDTGTMPPKKRQNIDDDEQLEEQKWKKKSVEQTDKVVNAQAILQPHIYHGSLPIRKAER